RPGPRSTRQDRRPERRSGLRPADSGADAPPAGHRPRAVRSGLAPTVGEEARRVHLRQANNGLIVSPPLPLGEGWGEGVTKCLDAPSPDLRFALRRPLPEGEAKPRAAPTPFWRY